MANVIEFAVKGIDQFTGTFNRVGKSLEGVEKKTRNFSKRAGEIGRTLSTRVTLPIAGVGAAVLKMSGDFEKSMNTVRAISQASERDFQRLRDQALELGSTTAFSASEAADGMTSLTRAGFETNEVLEAMPGVLSLAAAGQLSLEEAASRVTNVMSSFGREASEVTDIADELVAAANQGDVTVRGLTEGFAEVGSIAKSAGQEFELTVAALTNLNDVGIKGSKAGTALRNALARLLNPTTEVRDGLEQMGLSADQLVGPDGKLLQLDEIIELLGPHADNTGALIKTFGQEAGPGMAALIGEGSEALEDVADKIRNSAGEASRVATQQMEGFNGAMKAMSSATEGLAIAIADSGFLDLMTRMIEGLTGLIRWITELDPKIIQIGATIAATLGVGGPVLLAISAMSKAIRLLIAATGPIGLFITAASLLVTAWIVWEDEIKAIVIGTVESITNAFENLRQRVIEIWNDIRDIPGRALESMKTKATETIDSMGDGIRNRMSSMGDSITGTWASVKNTLVGNSIIPDMVNLSLDWFEQWEEGSVRKTHSMTTNIMREVDTMSKANADTIEAGVTKMEGVMSSAFRKMVVQGASFSEVMKSVFEDMVSQLLAELARLAANRIFGALLNQVFGGSGGGGGSVSGGAGGGGAGGVATAIGAGIGNFILPGIGGVIGGALGSVVGGLFHGGISNVPREGVSMLAGGERVLSRDQNEDFTRMLEAGNLGGPSIQNAHFHFFENATDADVLLRMSREDWRELVARKIIPAVNDLEKSGVRQLSIERAGR